MTWVFPSIRQGIQNGCTWEAKEWNLLTIELNLVEFIVINYLLWKIGIIRRMEQVHH